ncbi:MAG: hypothetical protein WAW37_03305 [Syntrophobacteraceae bacterium]
MNLPLELIEIKRELTVAEKIRDDKIRIKKLGELIEELDNLSGLYHDDSINSWINNTIKTYLRLAIAPIAMKSALGINEDAEVAYVSLALIFEHHKYLVEAIKDDPDLKLGFISFVSNKLEQIKQQLEGIV